jgi:hypothetical protein
MSYEEFVNWTGEYPEDVYGKDWKNILEELTEI